MSSGSSASAGGHVGARATLKDAIDRAATLLPAQGPIGVFVHHNTLHAFEDAPFERAVLDAGRTLGCQPYLRESDYRDALESGRIATSDVEAELDRELARDDAEMQGVVARREVWRRILLYGYAPLTGPALAWHLAETDATRVLRRDLPSDAREALESDGADACPRLWSACRAAARRAPAPAAQVVVPNRRTRDDVMHALHLDLDDDVHPPLIRFLSAYLDQGLADWAMPDRERGIYATFVSIIAHPSARLALSYGAELDRVLEGEPGSDAWESLERSLDALGVERARWPNFLLAEALGLRGWAGMIHQLELRPDRAPTAPLPATLVDYLAVRLLLTRAAGAAALERAGHRETLAELRGRRSITFPAPTEDERAWASFQVAQLLGWPAARILALDPDAVSRFEATIRELDDPRRRAILHRAYERQLRQRFYTAIARPPHDAPSSDVQLVTCIDEREESFRRHVEEVDARVETLGAPGFFGVAMYHQGATDARPRALCPIAVRPRHLVPREPDARGDLRARASDLRRRLEGLVIRSAHAGTRGFVLGALLTATLGVVWSLPLVLRVLFPRLLGAGRLRRSTVTRTDAPRLAIDRDDDTAAEIGEHVGFTSAEMADVVFGQLTQLSLADRLARLVVVLGHGSTSQNNPHRSVYDCGACGGSAGGPNARAFAAFANDPRVRAILGERGLAITPDTWFVGGERNTTSNEVTLFDTDRVPASHHARLADIVSTLEEARRREAHERCRRFESFPTWLGPDLALGHVEGRAADIAQTRPEYGHGTNAFCFVGRRARTRGLFLDRRAFLVSFDPSGPDAAARLSALLDAVVPVVLGINLEYFFGRVDPTGYGCGTKLPHNVVSLLGVMDGPSSDLRTGLHWQTLELHEPVRLTLVVEAPASSVADVLARSPSLARLVEHGWLSLAALDPSSDALFEIQDGVFVRVEREAEVEVVRGTSETHYHGRRDHLPFVAIEARA
ncbi:MAG: putative inorganic carbon transporter subunit DabA [Sandaracinaceae bacterium]